VLYLSHFVITRKAIRAVMAATNIFPKRTKMPPMLETVPNLNGLWKIKEKASLAAPQKLFPVKAI